MGEKNNNTFFLLLSQNMLRFAKKLDTVDNIFLKNFSKYLQETYVDNNRNIIDGSDWRMDKLDDFLSHIYLLLKIPYRKSLYKGCALFGETPFEKLDFIRAFLENYKDSEYINDGVTHNFYAIVDCERKAKKAETIQRYVRKYKDIPFIIFNNSENVLNQIDNLRMFKYLCEHREFTFFDSVTNERKVSNLESWYILLGNKNKIHEALEKARPDSREDVSYRINTFDSFIRIFDFDEEPENISYEELNEILHKAGIKIKFDKDGREIV